MCISHNNQHFSVHFVEEERVKRLYSLYSSENVDTYECPISYLDKMDESSKCYHWLVFMCTDPGTLTTPQGCYISSFLA